MSDLRLRKIRFRSGTWEGLLTGGATCPNIEVTLLDRRIENISLREEEDGASWYLSIPIPQEAICDGVQTFVISNVDTGMKLGDFTLLAGDPLVDDLRAELDLLRAELNLLKRSFRRHCLDPHS